MGGGGVGGGRARRITLTAVALTAGTGGIDVVSFTRLGGVFTSVMTANIVLLGLSIARASGTLAGHTALSVGCYVAGVAAAARAIGPPPPEPPEPPGAPGAGELAWPGRVTAVFGAELLLLAGLAAGWELTGGRPAGPEQYLLQGIAAAAMGMQSAAVRGIGADEFSTTYLTGQLTKMVSTLAVPGKRRWPGWHLAGPLLALIGGAVLSGVLIAAVPDAVPLITFVPLAGVLAAELAARRRPAGR
ncbi:MAG TPA: YoaK family protein [Streptosporangiaceae bacterium]